MRRTRINHVKWVVVMRFVDAEGNAVRSKGTLKYEFTDSEVKLWRLAGDYTAADMKGIASDMARARAKTDGHERIRVWTIRKEKLWPETATSK